MCHSKLVYIIISTSGSLTLLITVTVIELQLEVEGVGERTLAETYLNLRVSCILSP